MDRKEYTLLISSINSVVFSDTQCYDFVRVFKEFITHVLGLVLGLTIMIFYLVEFGSSSLYNWTAVGLLIVLWSGILLLFVKENRRKN
jgi:hypothetical protein